MEEPFVTAGKAQFPPSADIDVAPTAPGVSISATLHPATQNVTAVPMGVQILGGNYIEANNTITMVTPYGEIASSSVAQFSIGEGEESTRIVKRSPLAIVSVQPPFVTAGKSTVPPDGCSQLQLRTGLRSTAAAASSAFSQSLHKGLSHVRHGQSRTRSDERDGQQHADHARDPHIPRCL